MYAMRYSVFVIFIVFMLLINSLNISGLMIYGNDTGKWDIPTRILTSALAKNGDLFLWDPHNGDGFPQRSLLTTMQTNPVSEILGILRPYDYLSFALENLIWRSVGFWGAYFAARHFHVSGLAAASVGMMYVGSGVMSWAALSYTTFIGQMLSPWFIVAGTLAATSSSLPGALRASGLLALVFGSMVWCGYPGSWLTAPVLSAPVLLGMAIFSRAKPIFLVFSFFISSICSLLIVSPLISETLDFPSGLPSLFFRRDGLGSILNDRILSGVLGSVDFIGYIFANPSYVPNLSSAIIHPMYFGAIPVLVIIGSLMWSFKIPNLVAISAVAFAALLISNTYNLNLGDHPLFRRAISGVDNSEAILDISVYLLLLIPSVISGYFWRLQWSKNRLDYLCIFGSLYVLVIATNNPLSNFLRLNVPPFVLVRYNHLYTWIVVLLSSICVVKFVDKLIETRYYAKADWRIVRAFLFLMISILIPSILVAIGSEDSFGLGSPIDGQSLFHFPHVIFSAFILSSGFAVLAVGSLFSRMYGSNFYRVFLLLFLAFSSIISISIFVYADATRADKSPLLDFQAPRYYGLFFDVVHFVLATTLFLISFRVGKDSNTIRFLVSMATCIDLASAVPLYFSDNPTMGVPSSGWPFSQFSEINSHSLFRPSGDGGTKDQFWSPLHRLNSSLTPPYLVSALRKEWKTKYNRWVLFPNTWEPGESEHDVFVSSGAFEVISDNLDLDINNERLSSKCESEISSFGFVRELLSSHVTVDFIANCHRLLVFTDSWAPGWSALIDGTPTQVLQVNNAIRGVMVPEGAHTLEWLYRPRHLWVLVVLFGTGLFFSVVLICAPLWSPGARLLSDPSITSAPYPSRATGAQDLGFGETLDTPTMSRSEAGVKGLSRGAIALFLCLTASSASLAAYDSRFDGPLGQFVTFLGRSILAGAWAWIVVAGRVGFRSAIGPTLLVAVLVPPLALQLCRHLDPTSRGYAVESVSTDFRDSRWADHWEVSNSRDLEPPGAVAGIRLVNLGGNGSSVSRLVPVVSPSDWYWWTRPLGRVDTRVVVRWTASIERSGSYFTVLSLGRLGIQAVKGGLLITAPSSGGDVRGDYVARHTELSEPSVYVLTSGPDQSALRIDGDEVWRGGSTSKKDRIIFGDASTDHEHGGSVTVRDVSIFAHATLLNP